MLVRLMPTCVEYGRERKTGSLRAQWTERNRSLNIIKNWEKSANKERGWRRISQIFVGNCEVKIVQTQWAIGIFQDNVEMVWWCFLMRTCLPSRRQTGGSSLARLVVVGRGRSWNGYGDERVGAHLYVNMVFTLCHCSNKPYKWRIKNIESCLVQLFNTLSFFSLMRKRVKVTSIKKTLTIITNVIRKLLMTMRGHPTWSWRLSLRAAKEEKRRARSPSWVWRSGCDSENKVNDGD